jgi:phthiodiolone/phenolphthiodiolone dimycocerosates ketoreductase
LSASPKFGLIAGGEPPFATAGEILDLSMRAEKDRYDSVWIPDHLVDIDGSMADPWSTIGYLSAVTRQLRFYTAVTDYQKVHPAKLAQIVATLDELSRGRITLGIGAGERMNNSPFGVAWDEAPVRVDKLREYIEVMRRLWSSSPTSKASFSGEHFTLDEAWIDQKTVTKPSPRVCIGAMGSTRMLRLIGGHGDGWLPPLMTPEVYRQKLRVIDASAREAGRDPASVERAYWMYVVADDGSTPSPVPDFIRGMKAMIATLSPAIVKSETGITLRKMDVETNFQRLVVSKEVVRQLEAQAASIPDSLVEKMCAIGSPDEIISSLDKAVEAGAQHLCLSVTRGKPDDNMKVLREKVLPYFREAARR